MTDRPLIHIVDDEEAIRKSTAFMLSAAGYEVESWASGTDFLAHVGTRRPGVVLLDVRMPDMDGLEVQHALGERRLVLPILVITGHGDVSIAVRAMKAGAIDFIEKPFEKALLLRAIATAIARLDDAATRQADTEIARQRIASLTPREIDVVNGVARGLSNKMIAHDLGISPRTVEIHRANLMSKLAVRSLAEALRIAFAAGIGAKPE